MNFTVDHDAAGVVIRVVGVGGGGGNAVTRMISDGLKAVEFIAINTDMQVLANNKAENKINIGEKITRGMGAGSDPEKGMHSAVDSKEEIAAQLKGANMIFLTAGMGGGTGTGASPVVAEIARDLGILTVGVVTTPFSFEGDKKMERASQGINLLKDKVDSLLVIPNERLKLLPDQHITLKNAFASADSVLSQTVQNISEIIKVPAEINLDFEDVKAIMSDSGMAHTGFGAATGKDKATDAANIAISSPLMGTSIEGAKGIILYFAASPDIGLDEVDAAASIVREAAHPDANIIFGVRFDDSLNDEVHITIIATGFDKKDEVKKEEEEEDAYSDDGFLDGINDIFKNN